MSNNQQTWLERFDWDHLYHPELWQDITDLTAVSSLRASWNLLERYTQQPIGAFAVGDRRSADGSLRLHVLVTGTKEIPAKLFNEAWAIQPWAKPNLILTRPGVDWILNLLNEPGTAILTRHGLS